MPLSAAARRAIAQAEEEGLVLVRSSDNASGFLGVTNDKIGQPKPYEARLKRDAVPASVDVVWLRGAEVRTTPPAPTAAAAAVLGKRPRVKEE